MFDKMRIKATLLQRTMFNDWAVVVLVVFVVVKSFESFKAITHKYEQNAASLEALRVENEGKIEALRAEKDGVIDSLRVANEAQIAENNLLKLTAKNMTIDGMLTRAREESARVAASAARRAARRARALSPVARRASASTNGDSD